MNQRRKNKLKERKRKGSTKIRKEPSNRELKKNPYTNYHQMTAFRGGKGKKGVFLVGKGGEKGTQSGRGIPERRGGGKVVARRRRKGGVSKGNCKWNSEKQI